MVESAVKLLSEVQATYAGLCDSGSPKVQKLGRLVRSMLRDVQDLESAALATDEAKLVMAYRHLLRRANRFYRVLGTDGMLENLRSGF